MDKKASPKSIALKTGLLICAVMLLLFFGWRFNLINQQQSSSQLTQTINIGVSIDKILLHPNESWLVVLSNQEQQIQILNAHNGSHIRTIPIPMGVLDIAVSPSNGLIGVTTATGSILLINTQDGATKLELKIDSKNPPVEIMDFPGINFNSPLYSIAFNQNGDQIAVGSHSGIIWIWDILTEKPITIIRVGVSFEDPCNSEITSLAFVPLRETDSHTSLIVGCLWSKALLWDINGNKKVFEFPQGSFAVSTRVAISPNGNVIATGNDSEIVHLWSVHDGNLLHTFSAKAASGLVLAYSQDGRFLATSGGTIPNSGVITRQVDYGIRLWNLETGKLFITLFGHTTSVTGIVFFPKQEVLISSDADGIINFWDISEVLGYPLQKP